MERSSIWRGWMKSSTFHRDFAYVAPDAAQLLADANHQTFIMLDTPQITQTGGQQTAVIRVTVPRTEIQKVMGPGIKELIGTVAEQGVGPAGPWFTHHLRRPTDTFEFEIGVPVTAPVATTGRVKPGQWPAMKVARAVYRGPYEGLAGAWGEFAAWLKATGHKPAADLWEVYVAGPESDLDAANYRTELNQPLVD